MNFSNQHRNKGRGFSRKFLFFSNCSNNKEMYKFDSHLFCFVLATKNDHVVIPKECHVSGFKNSTGHQPSEGYTLIEDR